jgi:hypothetical protein
MEGKKDIGWEKRELKKRTIIAIIGMLLIFSVST